LLLVFILIAAGCSKKERVAIAGSALEPAPSTPPAPSAAPPAADSAPPTPAASALAVGAPITLSSNSFVNHGRLPPKHTCDGDDKSPPLAIAGVPEGAKSLALVVEDPDAPDPAKPVRTWSHWLVYDLSPKTTSLAEGAGRPYGRGRAGKNDWGARGYRGPCPPTGRHRYVFNVFALDTLLGDLHEPNRAALLKAMEGHVIGHGEIVGTYEKGQ
jgi:Raf kinase inhibitor-like YbhB/YbcL family protein